MKKYVSVFAYIASIVAANWMTSTFGMVSLIWFTVTAGTFAAGFALILRDAAQAFAGSKVVLVAIAVGAVVSYATSSQMIALASGIAFLFGELVDFAVFTPLKNKSVPIAVLASSVAGAPVDTVLFLQISGFGVTPQAVIGQFIVKTTLAGLVAWWIACSTSQAA